MNKSLRLLFLTAGFSLAATAAVPPPHQLLPADTLAVLTMPDVAKAGVAYQSTATVLLWRDPAMKAFRDKLETKLNDTLIVPLERKLGVKFADYTGLAQGQFTLALIPKDGQLSEKAPPAFLLLVDAKERSGQLKTNLTDLRKKWTDAGQKLKTEKIRDVEFTTLIVSGKELGKTLQDSLGQPSPNKPDQPAAEAASADDKAEILVGQAESLLIVGNDPKAVEKVLARMAGGAVPALGEQAAFEADYQARLRNALIYGWINFKPITDLITRVAKAEAGNQQAPGMPDPAKIIAATGLGGLRTISFSFNESADGSFGELHLGVPAAGRAGVFKLLTADPKDSSPPPFVPADAVEFQRWRLDWQKTWAALEAMITEIYPPAAGAMKMMFDAVGKDKDPSFDLRRELIGNLGDDLISYYKSAPGKTLAELQSAPSIFLLGSPNADKLAGALKMISSLLPPPLANVKEREFLGRKIYSMELPPQPSSDGSAPKPQALSYSSSGGYVAISTDAALLESYLRSAEYTGKTLRETPGLNEAAQKIGGMNTGLFGYQNAAETMRPALQALKNDSAGLANMLAAMSLGAGGGGLKDWVDFALLPPFDQIAKYFYLTVYSGSANNDGLSYKIFTPTPPALRK